MITTNESVENVICIPILHIIYIKYNSYMGRLRISKHIYIFKVYINKFNILL